VNGTLGINKQRSHWEQKKRDRDEDGRGLKRVYGDRGVGRTDLFSRAPSLRIALSWGRQRIRHPSTPQAKYSRMTLVSGVRERKLSLSHKRQRPDQIRVVMPATLSDDSSAPLEESLRIPPQEFVGTN
jgi:hypothetical protein